MSHPDPWELYDFDETEYIEDLLSERSRDSVRMYLAVYGDAIEKRVRECLADARDLLASGQHGLSLVRSATASELVIGYLVVRPLVRGAIMSEQWAAILTEKIIYASRRNDKELLPPLVKQLEIDLDAIVLPSGGRMWQRLVGKDDGVWAGRDAFLHLSLPASEEMARTGIEAVEALLSGLAAPLAARFGLSWPETTWASTSFGSVIVAIEPKDPIGDR